MKWALFPLLALPALAHDAVHPDWPARQAVFGFGAGLPIPWSVYALPPDPGTNGRSFYLPYALERANLTEGLPGVDLRLMLRIYDASNHAAGGKDAVGAKGTICEPLRDAWVDIWSADAGGVYSEYGEDGESGLSKRNWNEADGRNAKGPRHGSGGLLGGPGGPGRGPPGHVPPTNDETFLRGVQRTDATGAVVFHTLFPGWYPGRTTHIHLKVHPPTWASPNADAGADRDGTGHSTTHAHTTQLYFPDDLNAHIATLAPYRDNIVRRVPNDEDGLFRQMKGASVVVAAYREGRVDAELAVGVDRWW